MFVTNFTFFTNLIFSLVDPPTTQADPLMQALMGGGSILLLVGVLAFMFFRQKKQDKQVTAMRNSLAVGDEITTIGGIIGRVVSIKEETCVIETSHERTKIRILKSSVSRIDVKADGSSVK